MTKTQHTPGPYETTRFKVFGQECIEIVTLHGESVCYCIGENRKANSNLFLASPELLEALEDVLNELVGSEFSDDIGSVVKARAAIAKARGK